MSATIAEVTGRARYKVAVALGSGLGGRGGEPVGGAPIPYSAIAGMPTSTVAGHEGALYAGEIAGAGVLLFSGRVHLYEGHDASTVTRWVSLAVEAGCDTIILTNAAGGIRPDLQVGTPYLISDQLNLTGTSPLIGPHDGRGPRFPSMIEVYDPALRALAREVDPTLGEGVYAGLLGPAYETPAEVRMLATLGADFVGMSTVLEAIMARYLGARVLGLSLVTNLAAGLSTEEPTHEEVARVGAGAAGPIHALLRQLIPRI
ncbi:MAG: purine-nucleoside phosphorylase [Actinomycetota bacterium]|nr:purine-nucleoside phosphorylase [Actinomycetota bacterium]